MLPVLGTGNNTAFIYDRTGTQRLLELPDTAAIEWGRVDSAVSAAKVTLLAQQCPSRLAEVHGAAHSVVVFRNDGGGQPERVWEGPLWKVEDGTGSLVLTAYDVTKWTSRRVIGAARTGTVSAADEMEWSLRAAFALDDPNVTDYVQRVGGPGPAVTRDVAAFSAYHDADLATLVSAGARYTALARSVIISTDNTPLGRLHTLLPNEHLLVGVTITEDVDDLTTRAIVRDDQGNVSGAGGVDGYYGLVESLASAGPGAAGDQAARADTLRARGYPTPIVIDVPQGAQVSCDAPFPISQLVPGMLWPVEVTTASGRQLSMTAQLAAVNVVQGAGADEKVTVTLRPVSSVAVG